MSAIAVQGRRARPAALAPWPLRLDGAGGARRAAAKARMPRAGEGGGGDGGGGGCAAAATATKPSLVAARAIGTSECITFWQVGPSGIRRSGGWCGRGRVARKTRDGGGE